MQRLQSQKLASVEKQEWESPGAQRLVILLKAEQVLRCLAGLLRVRSESDLSLQQKGFRMRCVCDLSLRTRQYFDL